LPAVRSAIPPSVTESLNTIPAAPLVLTIEPFRRVVPAASVTRLTSGVVKPTMPPNVVSPAALTTSAWPPSTVPVKVAAPEPVETVVSAVSAVVPNVAFLFVVEMVPARLVSVGAVLVRPPAKVSESVAASPSVTVPVLAKATAFVIETGDPVRATL